MTDMPPPLIANDLEPADEYVPVYGPQQMQALVNIAGILLRKMGGQIDVTAEELASVSGCHCNLFYNLKTGALRLVLVDPDDKVWSQSNVNYVGHA